ncbi:MAG: hypothetical protein WBV94_23870 [Blastocatellia bacterium]
MGRVPDDKFRTYFAEKVWEMIPAFYRDEDGLAENPGVLRATVEILAEHAANLRRSNDRLWDDMFIDLSDSWAIPYIAELVATRLVSSLNVRGRRVDVAKTIYYRRRKGTVRILEELISDIAGWEGVVVEEFRRLARSFHGLDPKPTPLAGRFTGTPPGGWADLRRPRGAELADGPFDEYSHSADLRKQRGAAGRHNIPKIAFHIYRIPALALKGVVPMQGPNNKAFTFDPSGRDIPLFMRRTRGENFDWDEWRSAKEWESPAPMRCRVLGHAEYRITESLVLRLITDHNINVATQTALRKLRDHLFLNESVFRDALPAGLAAPVLQSIMQQALIQDCGKSVLLSSYVSPGSMQPKSIHVETTPGAEVTAEKITSGNLENWTGAATGKRLIIDPERGRMLFLGVAPAATLRADYYYGFSAEIGAGAYDRGDFIRPRTVPVLINGSAIAAGNIDSGTGLVSGVTEIGDSSTFGPAANKSGIKNTVIQAKNFERPYIRLTATWVLDSGINTESLLTLEGLWIGGAGNFSLILRGDYEHVTIQHTTLDPGGVDASGNPISPLPLVIEGNVEQLVIDHSITGPIRIQGSGVVKKLVVRDSIIQSLAPAVPAIEIPEADVDMFRVTVFGAVVVDHLNASEALITGLATVTDTQNGCFRFSAAEEGSRVPHPYQSPFIKDSGHFFTSRAFGQPGYAQLSLTAPEGLLTGAENGSETGAFSSLITPIRLEGLSAKVGEFMPFGLIPVFIFET